MPAGVLSIEQARGSGDIQWDKTPAFPVATRAFRSNLVGCASLQGEKAPDKICGGGGRIQNFDLLVDPSELQRWRVMR